MSRKNFIFIANAIIESSISAENKIKVAEEFKHKISLEYSNFKADIFLNYIKERI
jgi:hypothetical protein